MIEVVQTDTEQPWHIRVISDGNSETLVSGENLGSKDAAFAQICAVAKEFGILNPRIEPVDRWSLKQEIHVLVNANGKYCGNILVHKRPS